MGTLVGRDAELVDRGAEHRGRYRAAVPWLEPFWDDVFVRYITRSLLAEQALWQGKTDEALAHAEAAIDSNSSPAYHR
jgi:hypothetical protein